MKTVWTLTFLMLVMQLSSCSNRTGENSDGDTTSQSGDDSDMDTAIDTTLIYETDTDTRIGDDTATHLGIDTATSADGTDLETDTIKLHVDTHMNTDTNIDTEKNTDTNTNTSTDTITSTDKSIDTNKDTNFDTTADTHSDTNIETDTQKDTNSSTENDSNNDTDTVIPFAIPECPDLNLPAPSQSWLSSSPLALGIAYPNVRSAPERRLTDILLSESKINRIRLDEDWARRVTYGWQHLDDLVSWMRTPNGAKYHVLLIINSAAPKNLDGTNFCKQDCPEEGRCVIKDEYLEGSIGDLLTHGNSALGIAPNCDLTCSNNDCCWAKHFKLYLARLLLFYGDLIEKVQTINEWNWTFTGTTEDYILFHEAVVDVVKYYNEKLQQNGFPDDGKVRQPISVMLGSVSKAIAAQLALCMNDLDDPDFANGVTFWSNGSDFGNIGNAVHWDLKQIREYCDSNANWLAFRDKYKRILQETHYTWISIQPYDDPLIMKYAYFGIQNLQKTAKQSATAGAPILDADAPSIAYTEFGGHTFFDPAFTIDSNGAFDPNDIHFERCKEALDVTRYLDILNEIARVPSPDVIFKEAYFFKPFDNLDYPEAHFTHGLVLRPSSEDKPIDMCRNVEGKSIVGEINPTDQCKSGYCYVNTEDTDPINRCLVFTPPGQVLLKWASERYTARD